jgi:hypothetical protein
MTVVHILSRCDPLQHVRGLNDSAALGQATESAAYIFRVETWERVRLGVFWPPSVGILTARPSSISIPRAGEAGPWAP